MPTKTKTRRSSTKKNTVKRTGTRKNTTRKNTARKSSTRKNTVNKNASAKKSFTSPYATSFNSAIKRGTPCSIAINNICKRTGKSFSVVCNSLYKANLINRQKFNGQWVCWAVNAKKTNATNTKIAQYNCWQSFCDWCICSGFCTPAQMTKACGSQKDFMNFCKKFWSKQFTASTTAKKSNARKSSTRKSNAVRNYKFPTAKKSTGSRRIRRAA